MAVDCALLDLVMREEGGVAFLRLYQWEPHCLSFGRHEPVGRRYDRERIRELGLDCVRRPTGGRAVWHARELTYAVAAPLVGFGGLKAAYRAIHEMLAGALRRLGLNAQLAPASVSPGPSAGPCFAAPVGGEVLVEGHKVVGSAQVRQGSAFLQHGSMLLEDDQALVRGLAGSSHSSAEAPVARLLQRQVTFAEAADAVAAAAGSFPGEWLLRQDLPGAVEERAGFHASRFRSPAWTWDR